MKTIEQTGNFLNQIVCEIRACETQEEKLELLIDWGQQLVAMEDGNKIDKFRAHFCVSDTFVRVWLDETDKRVRIEADSGTLITKGYLYVLVEALEGLKITELLGQTNDVIVNFAKESQMNFSQIPSRMNAFANLYNLIVEQTKQLMVEDRATN